MNTPAADLRAPGAVLLVSCYELGHQPLGLAQPLAFLEQAGFHPVTVDISVQTLDDARIDTASVVVFSVPMHTALRLARPLAQRIRQRRPHAHQVFVGHYAALQADTLLQAEADHVLGGEYEAALVQLVQAIESGDTAPAQQVRLDKLKFPVPSRASLPELASYAHLLVEGEHRQAGSIESTRGCRHRCRHCPIPAVYNGGFFAVPRDIVLEDARQQVAAGARHLTFTDADFLNAPGQGMRVLQRLHEEFPELTFDLTAKVEHLLRHAERLPEMARAGVLFVVTAVETLNDRVLHILDKGHTSADVMQAQGLLQDAGIDMRPSLMPFTPWTDMQDLRDIVWWVAETELVDNVDAVQYGIRLLVPRGSLLEEHPDFVPHRGGYDEEKLTWEWRHDVARMQELQEALQQVAAQAAASQEAPSVTFDTIWDTVHAHTQDARAWCFPQQVQPRSLELPRPPRRRRHQRPPRLTEPWFC